MSESQELQVDQVRSQDTSTFPENPTRNEDAVKRLVLIYK
jgi:hypothetical protein